MDENKIINEYGNKYFEKTKKYLFDNEKFSINLIV